MVSSNNKRKLSTNIENVDRNPLKKVLTFFYTVVSYGKIKKVRDDKVCFTFFIMKHGLSFEIFPPGNKGNPQ